MLSVIRNCRVNFYQLITLRSILVYMLLLYARNSSSPQARYNRTPLVPSASSLCSYFTTCDQCLLVSRTHRPVNLRVNLDVHRLRTKPKTRWGSFPSTCKHPSNERTRAVCSTTQINQN